jgi:hypothetical protein
MPADDDDTLLPFSLPSLCKKKVTAAFDGGVISSDGGVFLLAGADHRIGLIDLLAALFPDARDPSQVTHSMADLLRERFFAIACGYPDGNDLDDLRADPAFKMACGRLPQSGVDLASQPTISRLENTPDLRDLIRMSHGMVALWCQSYPTPPTSIALDIDDTADIVHGHQQMSLFNAHQDERCFAPIHVDDAATGHCVTTILRPGKTPNGREVRGHLRRLTRSIRRHWPNTRILFRGDSHYGRVEAMECCENNGVTYIFGLAPNKVLADQLFPERDACCVRRAIEQLGRVRTFAATRAAIAEDRGAGARDRHADQAGVCSAMPECRAVPRTDRGVEAAHGVTNGASAPAKPDDRQPPTPARYRLKRGQTSTGEAQLQYCYIGMNCCSPGSCRRDE